MKANELRIGNYVNRVYAPYGNRTGQSFVEKIESGNSIDNLTLPSSFCEGIPLSEEWLVRFGFKEPERGYEREFFYEGFFCVRENKRDKSIYYWGDVRLLYVHQLQNLYFALTGQELTLNN